MVHIASPIIPATKDLLTREEAAGRMNVTVKTLNNWTRNYGLPYVRIGSRRFYTPAALSEFIKSKEVRHVAEPH